MRREFEQRFLVYQKRVSSDALVLENAAYKEQVRAMTEQLMVQELFMACQRVELARFFTAERAAASSALVTDPDPTAAAAASAQTEVVPLREGEVQALDGTTRAAATSDALPQPPTAASSVSISSAVDAAVQEPRSSIIPGSIAASLESPRPQSASQLPISPRTAGSHEFSSVASSRPYTGASSSYGMSVASTFISAFPSPTLSALSAVPSVELLSMTEALLTQTEVQLQEERTLASSLGSRVASLERDITVNHTQHEADTAELRAQVALRTRVCTQQEEALHRLTFENRSLIDQLLHLQQQQQADPPHKHEQPSSHHLPPAASLAVAGAHSGMPNTHTAVPVTPHGGVGRSKPSRGRFVQPPPLSNPSFPAASQVVSTGALGFSQEWKAYNKNTTSSPSLPYTPQSFQQAVMDRPKDEERKEQLSADHERLRSMVLPALPSHRLSIQPPSSSASSSALVSDGEILISASPVGVAPAPVVFPPIVPSSQDNDGPAAPSPSASGVHTFLAVFPDPQPPPSPQQLHLHPAYHRAPTSPTRHSPLALRLHRAAAGWSASAEEEGQSTQNVDSAELRVSGNAVERKAWKQAADDQEDGAYRSDKGAQHDIDANHAEEAEEGWS